jgi:arylsulfatase A-like enzyme
MARNGNHTSAATIAILCACVCLHPVSTAAQGLGRAASQTAPVRPNIIVIALDDVGFSDIGAFGSEIATPSIDSIARNGLRYVRFDTNAICSATRASFLTGRNASTVRMAALASTRSAPDPADQSAYKGEIPPNAEFLSEALRRSGYATFAIGKWHLTPDYETGKPGSNGSFPLQRGFDYFYGYKMGWTDQYHPQLFEGNNPIPDPSRDGYLLSEDLVNHAMDQMKSSFENHPEKPVFLYLAMPVAHTPTQAPRSYVERYVDTYKAGWDAIREERFARQKAMGLIARNTKLPPREKGDPAWASLTPQQQRVYTRFMAAYAAYLQYGDEQIGRLLRYLKTSGQDQRTIVLLFSDNGAASETKTGGFRHPYGDNTSLQEMDDHLAEMGGPTTQPLYPRPWAYTGGTPFRRYKLWPYLGGIRTPMLIEWPGKIKDPGAIRRQFVHVIDIAPTLLDAAGTHFDSAVAGTQQIPPAGRSFLSTITDAKAASPRSVQFFELWGNRAITSGEWRAVAMHKPGTSFDNDQWHLFNMQADPSETLDYSKAKPAKLREMEALWRGEAEKYGDLPLVEAPPARAASFTDGIEP